ncbi:hypothetical protein [Francisella hispaniensis]|uniref:Uncharacterized protein n=1 Tax=Francisella hispaniensis FSC454 TaxID=1088883 RepID=A0AAC9J5L8_9GAMM|nr:hypothetical protein [Francisella hispaniensis]APD50028.1 hypothetical protein FSC454_02125 [Francisella hispaniensis FSC454]KYW86183.1 hypothetical protein AUF42_03110 [Francisella hispaniensis FSC454]
MSEETINIDKSHLAKKKACSYKNILGCICLVIILAIFCISEIAILLGIFMVFAIFYIIILSFGVIYISAAGIKKLSSHYQEKNKNIRNN